MSRVLAFSYDIALAFDKPVTNHSFVLRCLPADGPGQRVLDAALTLDPPPPAPTSGTASATGCRSGGLTNLTRGSITAPRAPCCGTTAPAPPKRTGRCSGIPRPSRCRRCLQAVAAPLAGIQNLRARAWALLEAVGAHMRYTPGVTGVQTTAAQAWALGQGVCQDYAHIYLALARLCGLSARYVNGLPEGEGASHAWCEVWLDGIWTGIDPTRGRWADEGYIRFCVGRDLRTAPSSGGSFWAAPTSARPSL